MSDHSLPIRQAVIQLLRASAAIQALVAQRVYDAVPDTVPARYIRYGVPIIEPWEADEVAGVSLNATIHCFDDSEDTDTVHAMMEAVRNTLQDQPLTIAGGGVHYYSTWTGSSLLDDGSGKNSRHGIVLFTIVTG